MRYKYFNREISWLSFNQRVLDEAADDNLSTKERLRFLAIFASNLDEFYKVKIYAYHYLKDKSKSRILKKINSVVSSQQKEFNNIFFKSVIPLLSDGSAKLLDVRDIPEEYIDNAFNIYSSSIRSKLQPIILTKKIDVPFLQDNSLYLVVSLIKKKKIPNPRSKSRIALVKIPFIESERFINLGMENGINQILFVEDIVRLNLPNLFSGYEIQGSYCIKILRNADFQIDENDDRDIVEKIEESVKKRLIGEPCLLVVDRNMPTNVIEKVKDIFNIGENEILSAGRYLRLSDLMYFPYKHNEDNNANRADINNPSIDNSQSMFKNIKKEDILLHFPYHSFEYVIQFLNQAALDKKVVEIKITWYRVAQNSAVANALLTAANNGKKVTVFVELKARFDEEQNIYFARIMENAGIKIIYTLPGLKVHAKMILVRRVGKKKGERRYIFLSTGNFNEKTASLYTDHGLFTCNADISDEINNLFLDIEKGNINEGFNKLLVAPLNLKDEIIKKIDREIENKKAGYEAGIIFKLNGLQNKKIIRKLYEASCAGVEIKLIVRGICCLVPHQPYSQNITLLRIVDQYLEHGRIYVFDNKGEVDIFMGSADMMTRNLDRRVEVLFPVESELHKKQILEIISIYLSDNKKATYIGENLENIPIKRTTDKESVRSQDEIRNYLKP